MNGLEILLDRRWILKNDNKELYYKVRDELTDIRKFATDKLGCRIIENALMVKMEKIPAIPEGFMGIEDFASVEEYGFFCMLLMFLEDKEAEEQFILSQLTEYIEGNMVDGGVDWTVYNNRRRLIRVLKYAVDQKILVVTEGDEEVFREEQSGEVLYENTGVSRYFMRNFPRDIMEYNEPSDFHQSDWFEMDEDRGMARRHRVYKRILFQPGMYRGYGSEEDFEYLKYYGRRMVEELESLFEGQVHIHKGSAFFLGNEYCRWGVQFPGNNNLSNILLLSCKMMQEKIMQGEWTANTQEIVEVNIVEMEQLLRQLKERYQQGFSKEYREMVDGKFAEVVLRELERWTFIKKHELQVFILPLAGKICGDFHQ